MKAFLNESFFVQRGYPDSFIHTDLSKDTQTSRSETLIESVLSTTDCILLFTYHCFNYKPAMSLEEFSPFKV